MPLIPRMAFHLTTRLLINGRHGIFFSENIIITENNYEHLIDLPRKLVV